MGDMYLHRCLRHDTKVNCFIFGLMVFPTPAVHPSKLYFEL